MLLEEVQEVFRAERQLKPMPSITAEELADFKTWALRYAERKGCANAVITGSISRSRTHPYSDIDLEMYTDSKNGYQAFHHWKSRLVAIHIESKSEMEEEVKDPYYQVWHQATLREGLVIKDNDSFIKKITEMANDCYQSGALDGAYQRLARERQREERKALFALNKGDILAGLYYLSYYIQSSSVYSSLTRKEPIGSEKSLTEKFAEAIRDHGISPADFCRRLREAHSDDPWDRLLGVTFRQDDNDFPDAPDKTWQSTIIALRRILEYRRKIYGSGEYPENPETDLFRLYCLGRIAGNYISFNKAVPHFGSSAQSRSNESDILESARQDLLSSPLEGARKASDTIMQNICDVLEDASSITIDGYHC